MTITADLGTSLAQALAALNSMPMLGHAVSARKTERGGMSKKRRVKRRVARRRAKSAAAVAGTKLRKRFEASGNRARYATLPQNPCYGRRSERRA